MLKVEHVSAGYGAADVLHDVSFVVPEREIVTILGANGAGKTTLMRVLTGLIKSRQGTVALQGQQLESWSPERRVKKGLALVPEGRELFPSLTVYENLLMGAFTRASRQEREETLERVLKYFPRLKERLHAYAASLSGGEGQMVAIGRALMAHPRVLLLDEPSLGLAPVVVDTVFDVIARLNVDEGLTIILVEQNARRALRIARKAYVLRGGTIAMEGTTRELASSAAIQQLYLGG
ncbi:ABC transporter ATP-binding protein [Ktedonobacter sp. SOSP1-52]|uniref:ABC transporter ATP-binding protein n=1 Tax=Ktedonobacter sp. SOSP1-52 TaxID=2778366 RepID=UPI001915A89B|nr:ABC transporter ATP-binding protein [Ktedonobacter sp. SOSP1-52]GHO62600.1 ABC transporter ATP-binding protein [Ktedonobacter sp. SOSP1-52]